MKTLLVILLVLLSGFLAVANDSVYRVAFYNFENLFDSFDDPSKADEDFTPTGMKAWSMKRVNAKINNMYKVIAALNEQVPACVIGACEVENAFMLKKLLNDTPLSKYGYKFIHFESPDPRGIDVAMLYLPNYFTPLEYYAIKVAIPPDTISHTRDVLYVKGIFITDDTEITDTVCFFVCHFPSRYGGVGATVTKRNYVANFVRSCADSILMRNKSAKILIMGDLNDDPIDESISKYLCYDTAIVNLMNNIYEQEGIGTLKHSALWSVFDQILVSQALLKGNGLVVKKSKAKIAAFDFLLMEDEKFGGKKLYRTHLGAKYIGGFSDHLPVYVDLIRSELNIY